VLQKFDENFVADGACGTCDEYFHIGVNVGKELEVVENGGYGDGEGRFMQFRICDTPLC
jgi:hypothetical protein